MIYLCFSTVVGRGCFTESMSTFMNVKKIVGSEEAIPIACGVVFICVVGIKEKDVGFMSGSPCGNQLREVLEEL